MAIPENRKSISTNLPLPRLNLFLDALEKEKVQHVPGSTSIYESCAGCEFDFEDARYSIREFFEKITLVYLISAKPSFVQTLINELEAEISVAVKERDYAKAESSNIKIEKLKKLL